jgi:hypothetical protein
MANFRILTNKLDYAMDYAVRKNHQKFKILFVCSFFLGEKYHHFWTQLLVWGDVLGYRKFTGIRACARLNWNGPNSGNAHASPEI